MIDPTPVVSGKFFDADYFIIQNLNSLYFDQLLDARQETSSIGYNAKLAIIIAPSCVVFLISVLMLVKLARRMRNTKLGI